MRSYHNRYRGQDSSGVSHDRRTGRDRNLTVYSNNHTSRILTTLIAIVLIVSQLGLSGCWDNNSSTNANTAGNQLSTGSVLGDPSYGPYTKKDGTWAIYWYLCGSDIELRSNIPYTATGQVQEMMNVTLPDNVTVVIQTGGAQSWHDNWSDPKVINRFVYRGNTLTKVDSQPLASMAEAQTLADFLDFCNLNYPAEKQVFEIADHGGGSLGGIAYDNLFNMNSLSLLDVELAISSRPAASGAYELVSLSACLMSTIDTIAALNGLTRYLVASEEVQLGCFWDYETFFGAIAKDTTINGATLGRAISDGYRAQCEQAGYTSYTTISVIDMAQADKLLEAYNNVGIELLKGAVENGAEAMALFGRAAFESENYGAFNGPSSDFDMADLGDLVKKAQALLPNSSAAMLKAIQNAVIYHVTNPQRAEGHGISCYYPYTAKKEAFDKFAKVSKSPSFVYYYEYGFSGQLSEEGKAYLASLSKPGEPTPEPEPLPASKDLGLDNHPLEVWDEGDPQGHYQLILGAKAPGEKNLSLNVAAIYLEVSVYDFDTKKYCLLGTSNDYYANWLYGAYRDDFIGKWGCLDGSLCFMEAVSRGEDTVLYRVPVLHNGVQKNLMVLFTWTGEYSSYWTGPYNSDHEGSYEILGLITTVTSNAGIPDPTYEELKVGDKIKPILIGTEDYRYFYFEDKGLVLYDTVTVTKDTSFYNRNVGPGFYMIRFKMIDYAGGVHYSEPGYYLEDQLGEFKRGERPPS